MTNRADTPPRSYLEKWDAEIVRLHKALDESVKLQSHYAELLNGYDGGTRLTFKNGREWIDRLHQTKPIGGPQTEAVRRISKAGA